MAPRLQAKRRPHGWEPRSGERTRPRWSACCSPLVSSRVLCVSLHAHQPLGLFTRYAPDLGQGPPDLGLEDTDPVLDGRRRPTLLRRNLNFEQGREGEERKGEVKAAAGPKSQRGGGFWQRWKERVRGYLFRIDRWVSHTHHFISFHYALSTSCRTRIHCWSKAVVGYCWYF